MAQIHLGDGKWLLSDCGQTPSDKNCQLVIAGPESQREDMLDAVMAHVVKDHGHEESAELRAELNKTLIDLE